MTNINNPENIFVAAAKMAAGFYKNSRLEHIDITQNLSSEIKRIKLDEFISDLNDVITDLNQNGIFELNINKFSNHFSENRTASLRIKRKSLNHLSQTKVFSSDDQLVLKFTLTGANAVEVQLATVLNNLIMP